MPALAGRPDVADDTSLQGVFFDMDGTLLDSEPLTDMVILHLLEQHGLPRPRFSLSCFHGVTWERIAASLVSHYPVLGGEPLIAHLQSEFHERLVTESPPLIAGVQQVFTEAAECCTTGVVSSSQRQSIHAVIDNAGLASRCSVIVGAEDVQNSKPHPECYLLAAERAGADPRHCLVFEDSTAGIEAARASGMYSVGVVGNREAAAAQEALEGADLIIGDFEELPDDFFKSFGCTR